MAVGLVMAAVVVAMSMPAFAKITAEKRNGGGNEPQGNANGVPTVNVNPSGHAPPGQN
jgi:hypothetical protein